jgi:hypothetical protein
MKGMPYTGAFFDFKDLREISIGSNWLKHELIKLKTGWEEDKPNTGIEENNHIPYSQLVGKICVFSIEVYIREEETERLLIAHSRNRSGPKPSHLGFIECGNGCGLRPHHRQDCLHSFAAKMSIA